MCAMAEFTVLEAALALVEKQIAEAEAYIAKQRRYVAHLESSGSDSREPQLLLKRLEDAQRRRIERKDLLQKMLARVPRG